MNYKKILVAPLVISLALSSSLPASLAFAEENIAPVAVTPIISYADVATASYDNNFSNAKYNLVDGVYNFTVNIDNIFDYVAVNGKVLEIKVDAGGKKYIEFTLDKIEEDANIKIGYTVGKYAATHDFKFDFTPTFDEAKADLDAKLAVLAFTDESKITTAANLKDANNEMKYVNGAVSKIKATFPKEAGSLDVTTNENYKKQVSVINAYKDQQVQAVITKITDLKYLSAASIKTKAQLATANAQVQAVAAAVATAITNGLTKAEVEAIATYKNIEAQEIAIKAFENQLIEQLKQVETKIADLKYTKAGSINTKAQLTLAKSQVKAVDTAISTVAKAGVTNEEITQINKYKNLAAQNAVIKVGVKQLQTNRTLKVTTLNYVGAKDSVKVTGVKKGDTVRLYNAKGKLLATATATTTFHTFTKTNLGKEKGSILISAQAAEQKESIKVKATFKAEPITGAILSKNVAVKNNKGKADTITVKGLLKGDTVTIYSSTGKKIITKQATATSLTFSVKQIGTKAGKIQLTRLQAGKNVSAKTVINFAKEK